MSNFVYVGHCDNDDTCTCWLIQYSNPSNVMPIRSGCILMTCVRFLLNLLLKKIRD